MTWKYGLASIFLVGSLGADLGCTGQARASGPPGTRRPSAFYTKSVAGYKVQLVAVADSAVIGRERLADHAWTPDGFPYDGPEARLALRNYLTSTGGEMQRCVVFELQPLKADEPAPTQKPTLTAHPIPNSSTTVDVFAYLPKTASSNRNREENPGAAGPLAVQLWHGAMRDSGGQNLTPMPGSVEMGYQVQSTDSQPVVFGIAQGEYKVVAKGPTTLPALEEKQNAVLASGNWGRIEVTHLKHPMVESKPSPTHRFRLLGGAFPPKTERKAFFYDSKGNIVASCGDGPNSPGYAGGQFFSRNGPTDIARFEVQERPYSFAQFDGVSFGAPQFNAYSGSQGLDHVVDSPIGKVVGVLKSTKDGPWMGGILYSADGVRWLDPGADLAPYEYGQFDPWNHPSIDRNDILFEPDHEYSSATTPTSIEVYAADSPNGPKKEDLTSWKEMPFRMPMTSIPCKPTSRPYMLIEARVGNGAWNTLETIVVSDQMQKAAESGPLGTRILEVFFDDEGGIRIWRDETNPIRSKSRWRLAEQRIRAIAHLRDGTVAVLDFNMSGYGGSPPNEKRYRGFEYTRQLNGTHVQSGFKSLEMKDIVSIDLQAQDLKTAISIPVHSPVN